MPERFTLQNSICDRRCSKCKKTNEVHFFTSGLLIYKTCNACRFRTRQLRRARLPDSDYDGDDVDAAFASLSLYSSSSSASAASTSAGDYFVDEPEPEPEPKT